MDYSKKQKQLDVKKWVDSELKGYDTCGEYKYCTSCSKTEAYPCAYAYEIYNEILKLSKASKTTTTKKATTTKTSTAKKTTAKKTTTSKKTTKATAEVC